MKIAIIDSGVHAGHPHVGGVAGGVAVTPQGLSDDYVDRLGPGTAVAGAIREKAGMDAGLYAVKVFDLPLSLSLGTTNPAHRSGFERAIAGGPLVVSAAWTLPGDLPGVISVAEDEKCPRESYRFQDGIFYASPYPRSIPGVPADRNLHRASFAVASMTGFVACACMEHNARLSSSKPADLPRAILIERVATLS